MLRNPFKASDEANGNMNAILVTANVFFGLDGGKPYVTTADFLAYGESLRPKEVIDLSKMIGCLAANMKMNGNPNEGVDAGGKPYTFHQAYKAKATLGFKLVNGGGFPQLISDYQEGKITIKFTLDELIKVAREA